MVKNKSFLKKFVPRYLSCCVRDSHPSNGLVFGHQRVWFQWTVSFVHVRPHEGSVMCCGMGHGGPLQLYYTSPV